jgi:ABC-type bacteriocin/lantibiotic exporter with double-glycine peptidase domain
MLTAPEMITKNPLIAFLYKWLEFEHDQDFLIFLSWVTLDILILSILVRALYNFLQLNFALKLECSLGLRMVNGYLNHEYARFFNKNSANLGKMILSEINQVIGGVFIPILQLLSSGIVLLALTTLLIVTNPMVSGVIVATLLSSYVLIYKLTSSYLKKIGDGRFKSNEARYKIVSQAFSGLKEIKVASLEEDDAHDARFILTTT